MQHSIITRAVKPALCVFILLLLDIGHATAAYTPRAERVVDQVYAIIGPLGQRSEDNDGLNNNLGFIVGRTGVILIDSGASQLGAKRIEQAIAEVTALPVKWVINTGSQDHRWLGNDYFASRGAEIIALVNTAATQKQYASQQMQRMAGFLNQRFAGTEAHPADTLYEGDAVDIDLDGQKLQLRYTNAHYPGDAWVWLPEHSVLFTGDLVYVDRIFTVLPWSSVINGHKAFQRLVELNPKYIVPGHGRVSDLNKVRRDCGDYYEFLVEKIGTAAQDMEPMQDTLKQYENLPGFRHLEHYDSLHRTNMNRTYLEFEQL